MLRIFPKRIALDFSAALFLILSALLPTPSTAQSATSFLQEGPKLVGAGPTGTPLQGAVAISADGNTAIVGGWGDAGGAGAAWVFVRSNGGWAQQGGKLIGTGAVGPGPSGQGLFVALSADGDTAILGGQHDNSNAGAAWVFVRSNGLWSQQGGKLVGTGAVGAAGQGTSVSVSADGNTALIGGPGDNSNVGAVWIFTRNAGVWSQQGSKLVGPGAVGPSAQGFAAALSGDGNTALVGGILDNSDVGAAWIFVRNNGSWAPYGNKLVGTGSQGGGDQGYSVSLSADGSTAAIGGNSDATGFGAVWVFALNNTVWTQQGAKLVGTGNAGKPELGTSVALSGDGDTLVVGGMGITPTRAQPGYSAAPTAFGRSGARSS